MLRQRHKTAAAGHHLRPHWWFRQSVEQQSATVPSRWPGLTSGTRCRPSSPLFNDIRLQASLKNVQCSRSCLLYDTNIHVMILYVVDMLKLYVTFLCSIVSSQWIVLIALLYPPSTMWTWELCNKPTSFSSKC